MPAGCSRSSPRRRAFFILFPRRHGHLAAGGSEFCHLMPAGRCRSSSYRRAFFILFPAGMAVSTVPAGNFATMCPLAAAVLYLAGVHFSFCSPPVWSSRRCRRGICLHVPASRSRSSPCRRAYFIPLPRRLGRLDCAGGEFASVCPLACKKGAVAELRFQDSLFLSQERKYFVIYRENLR